MNFKNYLNETLKEKPTVNEGLGMGTKVIKREIIADKFEIGILTGLNKNKIHVFIHQSVDRPHDPNKPAGYNFKMSYAYDKTREKKLYDTLKKITKANINATTREIMNKVHDAV